MAKGCNGLAAPWERTQPTSATTAMRALPHLRSGLPASLRAAQPAATSADLRLPLNVPRGEPLLILILFGGLVLHWGRPALEGLPMAQQLLPASLNWPCQLLWLSACAVGLG